MLPKDTNIIIIGFGRIGQRHYANLVSLGYTNVFVHDVDQKKIATLRAKKIEKLTAKELQSFDVACICTPTHLHVKTALLCARSGCHIFIEKPLSHSLSQLTQLQKICVQHKVRCMVGCNMRFHPCIQYIKQYIEAKKLGNIYSIHHEFGENLLQWRTAADYNKSYTKKSGGIVLDDIHEFDLLFWLNSFSKVKKSQFICNTSGAFPISVEDNCIASFSFANNVLGSVRCDYLQQQYTRTCKIVGEKGTLTWNMNENIVWLHTQKKNKQLFKASSNNVNDMYVDEMRYFLQCIASKQTPMNGIIEAKKILELCIKK